MSEKQSNEKDLPELSVQEVSAAVESALNSTDADDAVAINIVMC